MKLSNFTAQRNRDETRYLYTMATKQTVKLRTFLKYEMKQGMKREPSLQRSETGMKLRPSLHDNETRHETFNTFTMRQRNGLYETLNLSRRSRNRE